MEDFLYIRISKYAPREGLTQLENFLTESFCDLLNRWTRVDPEGVENFICYTLLSSPPVSFRERLRHAPRLSWSTQKSLQFEGERGRPDLWLLSGKEVILLVENKITARFTTHSLAEASETDTEAPESRSQMKLYDDWLFSNYPNAGLVLLTHLRDAPIGFLQKETNDLQLQKTSVPVYKMQLRSECRWSKVCASLIKWREAAGNSFKSDAGIFLLMLMLEFVRFLEENNMNKTLLEKRDLVILNEYFAKNVWKKMRDLMEDTRPKVVGILAPLSPICEKGKEKPPPYTTAWEQTQIMWDWAHVYKSKWFVSWGVSSKNGLKHLNIDLPEPLQAFVLISSEGIDIIPLDMSESYQETRWDLRLTGTLSKFGLLKKISTQELAEDPKGFNEAFSLWVTQAVEESVEILKAAHNIVSTPSPAKKSA